MCVLFSSVSEGGKMAIVIIGGTGVGKSTVGNIISQRIGYQLYEVGHVVKQLYFEKVQRENILIYGDKTIAQSKIDELTNVHGKDYFTRKRLQYTGEMVRKYGNDYFIRALMSVHAEERIIIVGARTFSEMNAVLEKMPNTYFVALYCNTDRVERRFKNRECMYMDENTAKNIFSNRYEIEHSRGLDDVERWCNIRIQTDYRSPEEIADIIIQSYYRFLLDKNSDTGGKKNERNNGSCGSLFDLY